MSLPNDDLEYLFKDSGGVLVKSGLETTYGHLDSLDTTLFAGNAEVKGVTHTLSMPSGKITTLSIGATLTVDGDDYEILDRNRINDGREIQLQLKEA